MSWYEYHDFCGKKKESITVREIYIIYEGSELVS
jgi:hypothetical protein